MKTIYLVKNLTTGNNMEAYSKEQDAAERVSELESRTTMNYEYETITYYEL